jgi:hypothetical protein
LRLRISDAAAVLHLLRMTLYSFLEFALVLSLAGFTGCSSFNGVTFPAEPVIASLMANLTAVTTGGFASLTGIFFNGTGVITPGNLTVTSSESVNVPSAA